MALTNTDKALLRRIVIAVNGGNRQPIVSPDEMSRIHAMDSGDITAFVSTVAGPNVHVGRGILSTLAVQLPPPVPSPPLPTFAPNPEPIVTRADDHRDYKGE